MPDDWEDEDVPDGEDPKDAPVIIWIKKEDDPCQT